MKRRTAIKNLALAAGSLVSMPTWANNWTKENLLNKQGILNFAEQNTLELIIEAIIPESDTLGAKSVGVPVFIDKMLADCYEKPVVDNVKKGLEYVENTAQTTYNKPFSSLLLKEKQDILLAIEKGDNKELKDFYSLIKNLTIQGYTTSEYVMTKFLNYEMAPGFYHGCVPV